VERQREKMPGRRLPTPAQWRLLPRVSGASPHTRRPGPERRCQSPSLR
jgi:hypothetical protein